MPRHTTYFNANWAVLQQASLFKPAPNPTFRNPQFASASLRVLIVRLSPFRDVERSTPHLFLYQAVRRALVDAYIDMAFFPPAHDRAQWLDAGVPLLIGTQSLRDARDFDVVLVSNAYTLELLNLPYLLLNSGVPVLASERDGEWPPLILGGSNAMAAQALLGPEGDCIVDALFFGEGEREVTALITQLHQHAQLAKRERLLATAAGVTGLWIANGPSDQVVSKAICRDPQGSDLLVDAPVLNGETATTGRLQISFGCPAFCTFCFEGYDRKPYRELPVAAILNAADELKRNLGAEALDVYSFNFNTHMQILTLLLALNQRFERVNLKSQRVDLLATVPSLLEAEIIADKRSFTLGIEGISARMRAFLHKSLDDTEIETVLVRLMQAAIREIKLFFILTGYETEVDLAAFRRFVRQLKAWRRTHRRGLRVVFSFGLLVRMPFTPLSYDRLFLDEAAWRPIIGAAKSTCETNGFEFRLATGWDDYAMSQVLALGGTWLQAPLIELARLGHCYDQTLSPGAWTALQEWMAREGHWSAAFLEAKEPDWPAALDFVQLDIPVDFLYKEYRRALAGDDRGYCLGEIGVPVGVGETGVCLGCGACTTVEERVAITQHTMQHPGLEYLGDLEATMHQKWRQQPSYALVWLPPSVAGAEPAWLNALVMRCLLAAHPELTENLLSVRESLFTTKLHAGRYAGLYGQTVVGIKAWDSPEVEGAFAPGTELPGGVRFLRFLDTFEPGAFERMTVRLRLPLVHFPDAGRQLRRYLQAQYVPVNLRGVDDGYRFDIPEKALRKRVLLAGGFQETDGYLDAELVVSPKFDLVGYLRSFPDPARYREARAEVCHLAS